MWQNCIVLLNFEFISKKKSKSPPNWKIFPQKFWEILGKMAYQFQKKFGIPPLSSSYWPKEWYSGQGQGHNWLGRSLDGVMLIFIDQYLLYIRLESIESKISNSCWKNWKNGKKFLKFLKLNKSCTKEQKWIES